MKKALLLLSTALIVIAGFSKTYKIKVTNNQFTPSSLNARVGDTIIWVWKEGDHTSTSTTVPAGAKTWNKELNVSVPKVKYIIKVAGTYTYHCEFHSGMTGTFIVSGGLNSLVSDLVISGENAKALLAWSTSSQADVSYFSIQRSRDGSNFTEIAKVQPAGSTMYNYLDATNLPDKYVYYQVQAVDKNGNTQLSEIRMFASESKAVKLITSLSPNPITSPGHLMMQFNADGDGKMLVQLFGSGGELVKQAQLTAVRGVNNGHFHLGDLKPGTYYLTCTLGAIQEKYTIVYQ